MKRKKAFDDPIDLTLVQLIDTYSSSVQESSVIDGTFVQVGVEKPDLTYRAALLLNGLRRKSRLVCVDVDPKAGHAVRSFASQTKRQPCSVEFIQGSSFDIGKNFKDACAWIARGGCRCLECTAADIHIWAPRVARGGCFVLHNSEWRPPEQHHKGHGPHGSHLNKPVGVYNAMVGSEMLMRDFYLARFSGGISVWRRK